MEKFGRTGDAARGSTRQPAGSAAFRSRQNRNCRQDRPFEPKFRRNGHRILPKIARYCSSEDPNVARGIRGGLVRLAADCRSLAKGWVTGFEPAIPRSTIRGSDDVKEEQSMGLRISGSEFAHSVPPDTCQGDPELCEIIDAWDELPEPVLRIAVDAGPGGSEGRREMRECTYFRCVRWQDRDRLARLEVAIGLRPAVNS